MRQVVEVNSRPILFSPDDEPPLAWRLWALVRTRVIDEITGAAPRSRVIVETDEPDMFPRVADNSLAGLVGVPAAVFPELNLQNYEARFSVRAEGYVPRTETVPITQFLGFPDDFVPYAIPDLGLHREPVVIRGRTMFASGSTKTPVAGATIRITGFWRTFPPANVVVAPEAPNLVSVAPTTYFARPALVGRLRRREMVHVVGEDKRLLAAATAGSDNVRISDRVNIGIGTVVAVSALDLGRIEYLTVANIIGNSTADQPATIFFTSPLAIAHPSNALVQRATPQAPGADNQLIRKTIVGDTCIFLNGMTDLGTANVVEIVGGPGIINEYHRVRRFITTSDANGFYRLPPLSRAAQVNIQANDGVHPVINRTIAPEYGIGDHRVDFVFR